MPQGQNAYVFDLTHRMSARAQNFLLHTLVCSVLPDTEVYYKKCHSGFLSFDFLLGLAHGKRLEGGKREVRVFIPSLLANRS